MGRRRVAEEDEYEYEDEYEEELPEGGSVADRFASASWRRAALLPLILILFGFGAWMIWKKYSDEVLNHPSYRLTLEDIDYTPEPEWLKRKILPEVIELGSLEAKKIHDSGLAVTVGGAFALHPWVKDVERVRLHYPAKLEAVLSYRRPVAFVVMHDSRRDGKFRINPVDEEAVWLPPNDCTPEFARGFPRIDVGDTRPVAEGTGWGDPAVVDAAKIAELLMQDWNELKDVLYQIQLNPRPLSASTRSDFDIVGRPGDGPNGGTLVIHWGHAPGEEQSGEPSASVKFEALKQWVADAKGNGLPIDQIDLRRMEEAQAAKAGVLRR